MGADRVFDVWTVLYEVYMTELEIVRKELHTYHFYSIDMQHQLCVFEDATFLIRSNSAATVWPYHLNLMLNKYLLKLNHMDTFGYKIIYCVTNTACKKIKGV